MMESRSIGPLAVSVVGLGCNQIGTTCDELESRAVVHAALERGITLFDTADEYGNGRSEEVLGRLLRGHRNEVVLATKFGCPMGTDPACSGASARWITRALEDSLRRLGTDRIDLYQLHFPDDQVPIEETLSSLDGLMRAGKVRTIGCCNLDPPAIHTAAAAARTGRFSSFASVQTKLNLLRRERLTDVAPACVAEGIALIPYFPLASGLLTGKYRRGMPPPPGSRLSENVPPEVAAKVLSDATFDRIEALDRIANAEGRSLLELAVAWLASLPVVGSVICGATSATQVARNVAAGDWRLDAAIIGAIAAT
jgi:aryl-alcohol dehydrogenase-like predicted oxidoreductase